MEYKRKENKKWKKHIFFEIIFMKEYIVKKKGLEIMAKVKVKSFPASYGESFLVEIIIGCNSYKILIDCGFKNTYYKYIEKETTELDLMILTHIDDDHIGGAIPLLNEKKIKIKNIWFNDLYKIYQYKNKKINMGDFNYLEYERGVINREVGYKKAKSLSNYIYEENLDEWNTIEDIIGCEENSYKEIAILDEKIKIILLSPNIQRINELYEAWLKYLNITESELTYSTDEINRFYKFARIKDINREIRNENCGHRKLELEKLLKYNDYKNSVINNASIAFLIEIEEKKILFLGDSNGNDISEALKSYMRDRKIKKIKLDLVKVSHHGSKNNTTNEFFEICKADNYLIATNGKKYNHPDMECISKIICCQKEKKKILFNYDRKDIEKKINNLKLKETTLYELEISKNEGVTLEL